MSSVMLTATIAVPADRDQQIAFDRGRRMVEEISDVDQFEFLNAASELEELLDDFDSSLHVDPDGKSTLEAVRRAGLLIIDALEEALDSEDTTTLTVAGYLIYISSGPSWGDAPTDAADGIWNAYYLPQHVLRAMGFIPNYAVPLSRTNGNSGRVSDTDVVDAIALGLGTKPEWSGADELDWIANAIGAVRPHPGGRNPVEYRENFIEANNFDPIDDNFLKGFVSDEAVESDDQEDED